MTVSKTTTHYRDADGRTYYRNEHGHIMSAPTMIDGSLDFDSEMLVVDAFEYLDQPEVTRIIKWVDDHFGAGIWPVKHLTYL